MYLTDHQLNMHAIGVIIGVSSLAQCEQNLKAVEQGPLPQPIVEALDKAWGIAVVKVPPYYR